MLRSSLSNKNILVIGTDPWFGPLLSKHRITLELCKQNNMVYMEPAFDVSNLLKGTWPREVYLVAKPYHQEYPKTFLRIVPFKFPKSYKLQVLRHTTETIVRTQLKLTSIRFDLVISFNIYFPFLADGKCKFIFYAMDTHGVPKGSYGPELEYEAETLAKADMVVAGTETLYQDFQGRTRSLKFLPHGVDIDAITQSATLSLSTDLQLISRPIIGFLGAVNSRLDIALIEYIGHKHPNWSLVFIGPYEQSDFGNGLPPEKLNRLKAIPNLYLLGPRPSDQIGFYFKNFNVTIMPYDLKNPYVHFASHKPLQSLAVGTPVVTTCRASKEILPPSVRVGETPEAFIAAIEQTLAEHTIDVADKARAFAREHSWQRRVDQLSEWIIEIA